MKFYQQGRSCHVFCEAKAIFLVEYIENNKATTSEKYVPLMESAHKQFALT